MTKITMKATVTALLLAAGPASAFCPPPPAVLKPQPGEVYGCPVYARTAPGKFWFSDFVVPFDNNLYGFALDPEGKSNDQVNQITTITAHNWQTIQLSNVWGIDIALAPVTFTPTQKQFETPDGTAFVVTGGFRQGF